MKKLKYDDTFPFLPKIEVYPLDPPDPPTEGWWRDPFGGNTVTQRYYDGTRWTQYVSVRTPKRWTDVFEHPPPTATDSPS
jgi:hypothetical protein